MAKIVKNGPSEHASLNAYSPSPVEQRLLEALVSPESFGKSITEICQMAECSRAMYYAAIKKSEFLDLVNTTKMEQVKSRLGTVIEATIKYAQLPQNHQDRKLLMEMAGSFTSKLEITGSNGGPFQVQFIDDNQDDESENQGSDLQDPGEL